MLQQYFLRLPHLRINIASPGSLTRVTKSYLLALGTTQISESRVTYLTEHSARSYPLPATLTTVRAFIFVLFFREKSSAFYSLVYSRRTAYTRYEQVRGYRPQMLSPLMPHAIPARMPHVYQCSV